MLEKKQILPLVLLAVGLWAVAALYVRLMPSDFLNPWRRGSSFVLAFPIGWICLAAARRLAGLAAAQYVAATALVAAVAMCLDAVVLQLAPTTYGPDETTRRFVASWLLWGYGAAVLVAFAVAARSPSRAATAASIAS